MHPLPCREAWPMAIEEVPEEGETVWAISGSSVLLGAVGFHRAEGKAAGLLRGCGTRILLTQRKQ